MRSQLQPDPQGSSGAWKALVLVPRGYLGQHVIKSLWPGGTGGILLTKDNCLEQGAKCKLLAASPHRSWGMVLWPGTGDLDGIHCIFCLRFSFAVRIVTIHMLLLPNSILSYDCIMCCQWTFGLFPDLPITNRYIVIGILLMYCVGHIVLAYTQEWESSVTAYVHLWFYWIVKLVFQLPSPAAPFGGFSCCTCTFGLDRF